MNAIDLGRLELARATAKGGCRCPGCRELIGATIAVFGNRARSGDLPAARAAFEIIAAYHSRLLQTIYRSGKWAN